MALSFSFLALFAFSFFFVSPPAPLVDSVPEAPEVAAGFSELAPAAAPPDVPLVLLSLLLMPPLSAAPELVPALLPDVPDVPEAPLVVSDEPELAPIPLVPEEPDEVSLEEVPDAPDGLEPKLPGCADGDALPPALVAVSDPALEPAPCANANEDTDATKTNDSD